MLVLSRKLNEKIKIGHDITITVVDVRGDRVRLGIIAPKNVIVHREEIYDELGANPLPPKLERPGRDGTS